VDGDTASVSGDDITLNYNDKTRDASDFITTIELKKIDGEWLVSGTEEKAPHK
jgi:hypothetical protein